MVSSKATTVADYLAELPAERRAEVERVRDEVNTALPDGFQEAMRWGMITRPQVPTLPLRIFSASRAGAAASPR